MRKISIAGMLTVLSLLSPTAATAAPDNSDVHISGVFVNYTIENYVNIRPCPHVSNACAPVGQAQMSHPLTDYCFVVGDTVDGTPYWDRIYDQTTGKSGYITEAKLDITSQGQVC